MRVTIRKRIPVAGGMGGGSADAAAFLRMAESVASVRASAVAELAAELGADVPSQLEPGWPSGPAPARWSSRSLRWRPTRT